MIDTRFDAAVDRLRAGSGVTLAFGGVMTAGRRLTLRHFAGQSVGALDGVELEAGHGLGGKVLQVNRTVALDDYMRTPKISHRYDAIISAEGLRAMIAAPVVVGRTAVGVLYGAMHTAGHIGDRVLDVLTLEAGVLGQDLAVDEARRDADRLREDVRQTYTRLRAVAARSDAPELTSVLDSMRAFLEPAAPTPSAPHVTARERDVLSLVALGRSNIAIAEELGLTVSTVKSYMKSIMAKLDASTRHEAAHAARRAGLVP
ncbi:LuxR family transcriptional regulator [Rhodococcus sp. BP-332]|uniref:LuxR C-terminal-related transcriptional regulator n=1 Tax=Rhodococcus sp. BP-332 TaxID=2739447 RepID=UPI001C9B9F25|nr:LuxR C-terminal-related transcriptional regulator [Rhodococcus sp. BP-332]MBY6676263.1 LuxR family transcriptional regulator [Rhodococcus sp. BP-332]